MKIESDFQIPYKAPLAEIPPEAKAYADMAARLKAYKSDLKKAKRACQHESVIQNIMQRIALIERDMENHSKGRV